jgi:hypothetical protein
VRPPDSRAWFGLGLFALTAAVFALLAHDPRLAENHLFSTLAQAVVITGLINLAAGYEFGASKPPAPPTDTSAKPRPSSQEGNDP